MPGFPWTSEEHEVVVATCKDAQNLTEATQKAYEKLKDKRTWFAVRNYISQYHLLPLPRAGVKREAAGERGFAAIVGELEKKGYRVIREKPGTPGKFFKIPDRFEGNYFEVGVVSDTQLCSKYQQLTFLHEAYDLFAKRGIQHVLHAGDLMDGQLIYRGHSYEVLWSGEDAQRDYTVANYPIKKGITTHLIGGNHDYSFYRTSGSNVLAQIAKQRPDIHYLGDFAGTVEISGIRIGLRHPRGGVPYARSYRLQKLIEQLSPQEKPHILLVGHLHIGNYLPMYRNVEGFQLPCFQAQTPFLAELGVYPTIAFLILGITIHPKKPGRLVSLKQEWFYCFNPRTKDWG